MSNVSTYVRDVSRTLDLVAHLGIRAELDAASLRAAEEILADGTPANTDAQPTASALRYWAAWYGLRYAAAFGDAPLIRWLWSANSCFSITWSVRLAKG